MSNIFTHWKTSLIGLLIGVFTIMFIFKSLTIEQYIALIGLVGTIGGLLAKDWDKAK